MQLCTNVWDVHYWFRCTCKQIQLRIVVACRPVPLCAALWSVGAFVSLLFIAAACKACPRGCGSAARAATSADLLTHSIHQIATNGRSLALIEWHFSETTNSNKSKTSIACKAQKTLLSACCLKFCVFLSFWICWICLWFCHLEVLVLLDCDL